MMSTWLERTASTALRTSGVTTVAADQVRLWREKFSNCVRHSDHSDNLKSLQELFSLDREYDLEDAVKEFVEPFNVLVNYEEFTEIDDRSALLKDSTEAVAKMLPDTQKRLPGTAFGSLLDSFPAARKVYDDAVLHLAKLQHTQKMLEPYQSKLRQFRTCLQAVAGCLLECDDSMIDNLCGLGRLAPRTRAICSSTQSRSLSQRSLIKRSRLRCRCGSRRSSRPWCLF